MSRRLRLLGVSAIVAGVAGAAIPATASAVPVITMSGSTSVAPLASLLAKAYLKQYPGRVKFKLAQGGSDVGVADVAAGRVTIGNSSRDPKATDPGGLVFNKIAKDAICIVTNPANPLANLSQAQIQAIFSGAVRDWSDVPGAATTGSIDLVVRTAASGTQDAFQKIFMGIEDRVQRRRRRRPPTASSSRPCRPTRTRSATCRWTSSRARNAVAYKGVACTLRNAKSGQYGGVRNFWMVTRGRAARAARCRSSSTGSQNSADGPEDRRARTGSRCK